MRRKNYFGFFKRDPGQSILSSIDRIGAKSLAKMQHFNRQLI